MKDRRLSRSIVTVLSATLLATGVCLADEVLVCRRINAKQMPGDFVAMSAIAFTGPDADGRRGSAGFVMPTEGDAGTKLSFSFQRAASGYGFQVIHPLGKGHVMVSVHSQGMTIHRGGSWGDIGWGNPGTSDKVELNADAHGVLPLKPDVSYQITSGLSATGEYELMINDRKVCRHSIERAESLVLEVPEGKAVWGGSGTSGKQFEGALFEPKLQPGHVGLILGPMDGSGPTQNFQDIKLTLLPAQAKVAAAEFGPLLKRIDDAREFDKLVKSKVAGGPGGGPFESVFTEPTLLVGFEYTLSTFYGGHLTVKSVRPIYQTVESETLGKWHGVPHGKIHREQAKAGYVVTAIVAKHGHRVDGMRLIYMRVSGTRLDPDDTYRSDWIGGLGGGGKTLYATYGDPIVSIFGRQGADLDAIGFVQVDTE